MSTTVRQHVNAYEAWTKSAEDFERMAQRVDGDHELATALRRYAAKYTRLAGDAILAAADQVKADADPSG